MLSAYTTGLASAVTRWAAASMNFRSDLQRLNVLSRNGMNEISLPRQQALVGLVVAQRHEALVRGLQRLVEAGVGDDANRSRSPASAATAFSASR